MKAYLAGPFFNEEQIAIIDEIASICDKHYVEVFNPKEECVYEKDVTKPEDIFNDNVTAILKCDILIAVTDGKDVGTMFECGFAYRSEVPIVYLWLDSKGMKFNIMLNESSHAVCYSYEDLEKVLRKFNSDGIDKIENIFEGELE